MSEHDVEDETRSLTTGMLAEIVRGRTGPVDPSRAARALLGRNQMRPVESAELLLGGREVDPDTKRAAIKALGRSTERGAQELLLGALREPNPHVLRDAVWALARVGDGAALEALTRVDLRRRPALSDDLVAAQRLLAFRLGKPGFGFREARLPERAELGGANLKEMKVSEVKAEVLEANRKIIALESGGIEVAIRDVTEVVCLNQALWLLPTERAVEAPGRLMEAPAVAMAIFSHNGCTGKPFIKSYVLSEPDGNGAELFVTRLRGQVTHRGRLTQTRGGMAFELEALKTRYDPAARITGMMTPQGDVRIEQAQVSADLDKLAERRLKPNVTTPAPQRRVLVEPRSEL